MDMKNAAADMHEKILQSALVVFSRKGYTDATIKDISSLAGCNSITIFRHFEDKEKLFYSVVERFHDVKIDKDAIDMQLSYTNIAKDMAILAEEFFKIAFGHHYILRIFINDGAYFEKIHEYVWFVPDELKKYFVEYLGKAYPNDLEKTDAAFISELFVSYIIRQCLRYGVHEGKWELSDETAEDFKKYSKPEIDFIISILRIKLETKTDM